MDTSQSPKAADLTDGPLVTIGLPVFNASRYVAECLNALVGQTYRNLRIVISDNASTDSTAAICDEYAARDSRIAIVRGETNRGAGWNHRRVLELAKGTYFRWHGADDTIAPGFVAACVATLEANPHAVLAYPLTTIIDDDGVAVRKTSDRLPLDAPDPRVRFAALLSAWSITHSPFYGVMRLSATATLPPFGSHLASDRTFLAELALRGPFVQVEEYLMFRRYHAKHMSQTERSERELMEPETAHKFRTREFRVLRAHLGAAWRAPVSPAGKLRYLASVGAWAITLRSTLIMEARERVGHLARSAARSASNYVNLSAT